MRTSICIILFVLGLGSLRAADRSPFEAVGEDAWVAVSVRSLSGLREALEDHPLAKLFEDEDLKAFFTAAGQAGKPGDEAGEEPGFREVLEDEFQLSYDELFELFPGEAHLLIYGFGETLGEPGERPDLAVLAEFSGDEARMNGLMDIQFERNAKAQREVNPEMEHRMIEESFMGETLYFDEAFDGENTYIEDGYALVDGIFLLATPESRMRSLVEALKEGQEAPLGRSDPYLRMAGEAPDADLSFFLNFTALVPALETAIERLAAAPWMAGAGVTPATLSDALALEVLQGSFFTAALQPDGVLMHSGLAYTDKRGLLSLMAYGDGELPRPGFVPDAPVSSSVSLFDLGLMFENLERLLATASPALGQMLDLQLQALESNLGVNLRTAILENLGDETVGFSQFDTAGPETEGPRQPRQVIAFSLDDAELFRGALDAIIDRNPQFRAMLETEDYAGYQIYTIPGQPNPMDPSMRMDDVSYTVTRAHFILSIGRLAVLKECLGRLDKADGGFWGDSQTEALFTGIARRNAVGRTYTEIGKLANSVLGSLSRAWAMGGRPVGEMPDELDLPFILVTEINEEDDGIFGRSLLKEKDGEELR